MLLLFLLTTKLRAEFICTSHPLTPVMSSSPITTNVFSFKASCFLVAATDLTPLIPFRLALLIHFLFSFRISILCFIYFRLIWKIYHPPDTRFAWKTFLSYCKDKAQKLYLWKRKMILGTSNHI